MTMSVPTYSVCLATFRRPALLARTLDSLAAQILPAGETLEIVVVDNDVEEVARPVVEAFAARSRMPVRYVTEPCQNISLARNRSVAEARGEFLLFIDDDEAASPTWVSELASVRRRTGADAVFGQMVPAFAVDVPEAMRRRDFYYHAMPPTGTRPRHVSCGNCLIRAAAVAALKPTPFDPAYGLTGGEDTHFVHRLAHAGAVLATCAEAEVHEFVPRERATVGYLFHKSLKNGNSFARRETEFAGRRAPWRRLQLLATAAGATAGGLAALLALWPWRRWRIAWIKRIGANVGKLMAVANCYYRAYLRPPPHGLRASRGTCPPASGADRVVSSVDSADSAGQRMPQR